MDAFVTRTVAEEGALRRGSTSLDTNGCFNQSEAALYRHVRGHRSQHAEFRFAPFPALRGQWRRVLRGQPSVRSEEHTSELQSLMRISYAVFCLKKKTTTPLHQHNTALCASNTQMTNTSNTHSNYISDNLRHTR